MPLGRRRQDGNADDALDDLRNLRRGVHSAVVAWVTFRLLFINRMYPMQPPRCRPATLVEDDAGESRDGLRKLPGAHLKDSSRNRIWASAAVHV